MLDYRIETFITLCKERNYSKTAQILCITQPAVTQHIQYLERFYNCKLFEYENKQLRLTEQGKILERTALGLSASTKRLQTLLQESKDRSKTFKIGVSITACEYMMPCIIEQLYQLDPHMNLNITVNSANKLVAGLKAGLYEAILIEGEYNKKELNHQLFAREEYIGISNKKYDSTNIHSIFDERLICRENGSGAHKILEKALEAHGYSMHDFPSTIQVNNIQLIKELVKKGTGIAFVYKDSVTEELASGELYQIECADTNYQNFNYITLKDLMFSQDYENFFVFAKGVYDKEKELKSKKQL